MNKTIEFLDPDISPVTVEASQGCNVIIRGIEPDKGWSITVIGVDGEQVTIDFIGERPKREER